MNQKVLLFMLFLSFLAIFAFVCILLTRGGKCESCASQSQVTEHLNSKWSCLFADLSQEELVHVVQYLKSNLGATLEDASHAKPSDNCIYSVDLELPSKADALSFLDHGGRCPARQALVIVYFGNQPDPNVTEYVVGPLPQPMYHQDVTVQKYGGKVPYYRRPSLIAEHKQMAHFLQSTLFPTAPSFMHEVLNYDGANLAAMTTSPKGMKSGDRATWLILYQNVTGYFLHPVGLEVLIDHRSLDITHWIVKKVFYGDQYYRDMAQLEREFTEGHLHVEKVNRIPADGGFSSMKPRVRHAKLHSLNYELFGPHYSVKNNQVHSALWSFAYRMDLHRGPQLFDIRFKNERVVYELSVQDTMSIYGSNNPGGMSIRYMDGSFGLGKFSSPLMRGLDCPYSATYLNVTLLAEVERPLITRDAICVFEQDMGVPFRRHFSKLHSLYYGGLQSTALVFRSVSTIGNYDYIWDFVFYPNGAIENKVRATGYISSSYLHDDGLEYGNRVGDYTLGTIHTHFVGFKVDLDITGKYADFLFPSSTVNCESYLILK